MRATNPVHTLLALLCATAWVGGRTALARPASAAEALSLRGGTSPGMVMPREDSRMGWWREARFGMFIHWGVYAVPAGEWEGKTVGGPGEWIMESAHIPVSKYEGLAAQFNPVKYDPKVWAKIAHDAGCKYLVITSKHHDGFCLFDSALTDWDVARTPYGKDLLKPLAAACREEGVKFCTYYSIMDWHHPDYSPLRRWNDAASKNTNPSFDRFVEYTNGLVTEVIHNLDPAVLWFDGEWEPTWTTERGEALEKLCRGLKPDLIINNRVGKARAGMGGMDDPRMKRLGDFGTPEQEVPSRGLPGQDWETCMTMNDTWGFKSSDHHWKSSEELIRTLIDIASKGGNFLLNVGPTAEGEIPPESIERLAAMGAWLKVNGEAIYGTQAGPFERLPWGRCTSRALTEGAGGKGTRLFLHVFDWPSDGRLVVPGLHNKVREARLVDADRALRTEVAGEDVVVTVPARKVESPATVVVLDIDGEPEIAPWAVRPQADGSIVLDADAAQLEGPSIRVETIGGKKNIGFWTNSEAGARWNVHLPASGEYRATLVISCAPGNENNRFSVEVEDQRRERRIEATKGWDEFISVDVGTFKLRGPGESELRIRPAGVMKGALMNLREVVLKPVGDKPPAK